MFGQGKNGGCKPLVEVNGKKLLSYALDNLLAFGLKQAIIVVGKYADAIKSIYGDMYEGIQLIYAFQEEPSGIVNAILSAESVVADDIALQLSDEIFIGLKPFEDPLNDGVDFAVGYVAEQDENKIKGNYSVDIDSDGIVLKCTEKPTVVTNHYKGTGLCLFKKQMLDILRADYDWETNEPNDLCGFINLLICKGKRGCIFEAADAEININTEDDLRRARMLMG